ncbi:MAG TPA: FixH family protein [Gammaproteobacteria bacterium]|nr:FixH family protein [Gammaproteobacteria bacterium]
MTITMTEARRWYAEPWVWLLIALPMSAVIGGIITIYLAVTTSDGLVVDDYYKRGKAINMDLARDVAAASHDLRARLDLDLTSRRVVLTLESRDNQRPAQVRFTLLHPTLPGNDQVVLLQPVADGGYAGTLQAVHDSNWYVQLEADDWRLSGALQTPRDSVVVLTPVTADAVP